MKKYLVLLGLCLYCVGAQAQNTLAGNLTVQQTVKLTGAITPSTIVANANDYAPAGFSTATILRLAGDASRTITGLAGGASGRTVVVMNIGEFSLTLATESIGSSAANRFALGVSDLVLPKGGSVNLWYDSTSGRWRPAGGASSSGGGGGTVDQVARDAAAAAQATADAAETPAGAQSKADSAQSYSIQRANHTGVQAATTISTDSTNRFVSDVEKSTWNAKQDALSNATTLAKISESAGAPLWNGGAWPGGGGGSGTVTTVSVVTANGVSGTVATPTITPAITLSLGDITPVSVAATGTVTGSNLSGTNTGDQTNVSGNAGTATALQTARTINGVSFDGTANITVPAAAGTLTGTTLASGVTGSSLTSAAGGTFGTAAFTNSTAYDPAGSAAAITLSGLGGVPTTRTVNGHALSGNVSVTASDVGLGSVENTALSTWTGSANLSTVGTITAGTWHGTTISDAYISSAPAWNAKVSFPGFGTTAMTATVGNDARLSDARTPTAHNQAWSTITTTPTTLAGYGITDAQPLDSDLTAIATLATTSFGRSLLTQADASAARSTIGAGTSSFNGAYSSLSGVPSTFAPSAHSQTVSTISDSTTVGQNLVKLTNPGAVTFPRINANNTVSALDAASFRTAIGVSGGSGDVSGPASATDNAIVRFDGTGGKTVQNSTSTIDDSGNLVISGSLSVSGVGKRFMGDFSDTTAANRLLFQSSVTNGATAMWLIPNGTNVNTSLRMSNGSDPANSGWIDMFTTTGSCGIRSAWAGSGTTVPIVFQTSGATALTVSTTQTIRLNAYGAGTLVTDSSGNVTASSDARLKNVSGKFTRGLDSILQIQPKVFTWKPESGMNSTDVNVGFIAQDVQPAIPEAVGSMKTIDVEEDDGTGKKVKKQKREASEYLTLSDRPIIATLVNAVKELKVKNDELEARIKKLEAKK